MTGIFQASDLTDNYPTIALFESKVKAGFPSPAEAYSDRALNLHELAVVNPAATIFCWSSGDSMVDAAILPGDLLVVDKSLNPAAGDIVVATVGGEFTLKRLEFDHGRPILVPANPKYPVIRPAGDEELLIFGVVRGIYRSYK